MFKEIRKIFLKIIPDILQKFYVKFAGNVSKIYLVIKIKFGKSRLLILRKFLESSGKILW